MSWKSLINLTGASKERHPRALYDDSSQQSWCSSPISSSSSRPLTRSSSDVSESKVVSDQPHSPLNGKLSPADGVISCLKNKSTDEIRKLASDKDAYNRFFNSLEQVKIQNKVRDELQTETLQLARENLEKGPRLSELRNQCTIIRTSELAHSQEKLNHLERKMENMIMTDSYSSLLQKLQGFLAGNIWGLLQIETLHLSLLSFFFFLCNKEAHESARKKEASSALEYASGAHSQVERSNQNLTGARLLLRFIG